MAVGSCAWLCGAATGNNAVICVVMASPTTARECTSRVTARSCRPSQVGRNVRSDTQT